MDCYHRMRRWFSKPPAKVFLALVVLSIASFFPALLSNSHDLQVYQKYGGVIINDLPADDDGVGPPNATCLDDPNNLYPPDSDSRPCFPF